MTTDNDNPCVSCGACCTQFRISFYWGEADDAPGGYVPAQMTEQISPTLRAMRGTHPHPKRCIALSGCIAQQVSCTIYANRPTACRDFPVYMEDGTPNPRCTNARAAYGLPPLAPIHGGWPPQPTEPPLSPTPPELPWAA